MTGDLSNRLDRLAALRPAAGVRRPGASLPGADAVPCQRSVDLPPGQERETQRGTHIVTEERSSGPAPFRASRRSLGLLAPGGSDSAHDPDRWLFLDTETTGLAGGTGTYAFLVGAGWWENEAFVVRQLFMRDPRDEPSLLTELRSLLEERPVIVTFNGKSFDWPLLETRFRMTRLGEIPKPELHLDLLHPARQLYGLRLGSVALSELERSVLNLDRGEDIPSENIPQLYFDYLRGGPASPLVAVFRHNRMDIVGLAALAGRITALLDDPEAEAGDPSELFGVSRILHRRGETGRAALLYERALAAGLPEKAGRLVRRELALLAKRGGDFDRANTLWRQILENSPDEIRACEELAIHFEHRERDSAHATALTREALVRLREAFTSGRMPAERYRRRHAELQHRLSRLARFSHQTS